MLRLDPDRLALAMKAARKRMGSRSAEQEIRRDRGEVFQDEAAVPFRGAHHVDPGTVGQDHQERHRDEEGPFQERFRTLAPSVGNRMALFTRCRSSRRS